MPENPSPDERLEDVVRSFLSGVGEDPRRDGLLDTPRRVAEAWRTELLAGMRESPETLFEGAVFEESSDQMVMTRDLELFSLCEHHLLPFVGKAHVAYVPDGRIVGFSKIPRLVDLFSRRLQVQERLTRQIAEALETHLRPRGVAVAVEASHLCMTMRGVRKPASLAVTTDLRGVFREDAGRRAEFLAVIGRSGDVDPSAGI